MVAFPVALRFDSGRTEMNVPAGASIVSPSTSKVAVPSSTTYTSSWPPASSCSLTIRPSSSDLMALMPNEWMPRCSRIGMNLPRRSRSSMRVTFVFELSFTRRS